MPTRHVLDCYRWRSKNLSEEDRHLTIQEIADKVGMTHAAVRNRMLRGTPLIREEHPNARKRLEWREKYLPEDMRGWAMTRIAEYYGVNDKTMEYRAINDIAPDYVKPVEVVAPFNPFARMVAHGQAQ